MHILISKRFEFRKKQYMNAFTTLIKLGYNDFYIIEALQKQGPTFLDSYSKNVFYAKKNDPSLKNNGINEFKTLLEGCAYFNFDPDDLIIKLTGRYSLLSDYLLQTVQNNSEFDVLIKITGDYCADTAGFAMKYKYLKEMDTYIDYNSLEKNMYAIEYQVGQYIRKKIQDGNFNIFHINKLNIKAELTGSTTAPDMSGSVIH